MSTRVGDKGIDAPGLPGRWNLAKILKGHHRLSNYAGATEYFTPVTC